MSIVTYANVDDFVKALKAVLQAGHEMMRVTYEAAGIAKDTVKGWLESKEDIWLTAAEAREVGLLTGEDDDGEEPSAEQLAALTAEWRSRKFAR